MTPSEEAQQVVNAAKEGDDGSSKKYVDFDSYLGNFASKRRIKVWVFVSSLIIMWAGCCTDRLVSLGDCRFHEKRFPIPNGD